MKKIGVYRIWQILYPIGIYYVVSSIAYFFLAMLLGSNDETYMLRQLVCASLTIPFILPFYRQDRKMMQDSDTGWRISDIIVSVGAGAMLGIAANNLIAMTPLIEASVGFHEANNSFFAGTVVYEVLVLAFLIPIAEELLYRGVVFTRLRLLFGVAPAIVLSAVIFGVMHGNLVQFLYAGILGLLLAFLLQMTGKMYAPILGHIAANVAAVIRQETGWLSFAYEPSAQGIGFSLCLLAGTGVLLFFWMKKIN